MMLTLLAQEHLCVARKGPQTDSGAYFQLPPAMDSYSSTMSAHCDLKEHFFP